MVKPRPRKTERGLIPQTIYDEASKKVINGNQSIRKVAKDYGMCHVTLYRFVKALRENKTPKTGYNPYNRVFNEEHEKQLVQYCKMSVDLYFGLSTKDLRKLAFQFASQNHLSYPEKWDQVGLATEDWLAAFLRRNPDLSLRTPQATSLNRAMNFNRVNVDKFFDNLATVMGRFHIEPQNIYNVDETGITTVQKPVKVIAKKGTKQVGSITSQERGTLVTMCLAVNAVGNTVPPMFIFPRLKFQDYFVRDGPVGCIGSGNKSGWMQEADFLIFVKHFSKHANPSETNKVLLILDNHSSHISIPVIDFCKDNHITLLTFPPHTSHRLQPLDRGVFGPFKKYFNDGADHWMKNHPGKRLTIYDLPSIAKLALPLASTPRNILAGFSCTGIWPFNREIFSEADFAPSTVTDVPLVVEEKEDVTDGSCTTEREQQKTPTRDLERTTLNQTINMPSTSQKGSFSLTPEVIRPLPKGNIQKSSKGRRAKGKTTILTDTPEKLLLMETQCKKRKVPLKLSCATKTNKKGKKQKIVHNSNSSDSEDENESFCLQCGGCYSTSKEDWIQCRSCRRWAHVSCSDKSDYFICVDCLSD